MAFTTAAPIGHSVYVDATNGNDSTGLRGRLDASFLTIGAACSAASSGDTIFIGPGTFTITAQIVVPAGVNLTGSGNCRGNLSAGGTIIQSSGSTSFYLISPGNNCTISKLYLAGNTIGQPHGSPTVTFGCIQMQSISATFAASFMDVGGYSSVLVVNVSNLSGSYPAATLNFYDCWFSSCDGVMVFSSLGGGSWPLTVNTYRCVVLAASDNVNPPDVSTFFAFHPAALGGIFNDYGSSISAIGGPSGVTQNIYGIYVQGGTVNLYATTISMSNASSGVSRNLGSVGSNSLINCYDAIYDRSKIYIFTNGLITDSFDSVPLNVILDDSSGTINTDASISSFNSVVLSNDSDAFAAPTNGRDGQTVYWRIDNSSGYVSPVFDSAFNFIAGTFIVKTGVNYFQATYNASSTHWDVPPTPETTNNKNVANGYAGLDASGNLVGKLIIYADTASNLGSLVPAAGQPMFSNDTHKLKIGDGSTAWSSLPSVTLT